MVEFSSTIPKRFITFFEIVVVKAVKRTSDETQQRPSENVLGISLGLRLGCGLFLRVTLKECIRPTYVKT